VFNGRWSVLCHDMLRCDILYQDVKAYIPSFDMQRRLDESHVAILNHMYQANRICFLYCRYLPIRLVQMVPCLALNGRSRLSRFPMSALRLQMFRSHFTPSIHLHYPDSSLAFLEFSAFCNRIVTLAAILWKVSSKQGRVTG
jgi:hypothetical protein